MIPLAIVLILAVFLLAVYGFVHGASQSAEAWWGSEDFDLVEPTPDPLVKARLDLAMRLGSTK